eukprot:750729-Hanusia_phi.AAC.1
MILESLMNPTDHPAGRTVRRYRDTGLGRGTIGGAGPGGRGAPGRLQVRGGATQPSRNRTGTGK